MLNTKYPRLENAPIVEAIIDIRVKSTSSIDITALNEIEKDVADNYILDGKQQTIGGVIKFDKDGKREISPPSDPITTGYLFKNQDNQTLFQARLDGFTFNMLAPYTEWDDFKKRAYAIWEIYSKHVPFETISRVAVRFVNKVPLQMPFEASEYFTTYPKLSDNLDKYTMANLFCQITLHQKNTEAFANITQAVEITIPPQCLFIFDIDAFLYNDITRENLWDSLDKLRDFKNEIFFESITDRTIKIFDKHE